MAIQLGIVDRVEFVGAVEQARIADFYRSVDVLAVPSLTTASWVEQFGRVALEAMACGVPVVVSDSGALPETVGSAALVVPEGDVRALAEASVHAGTDPAARARLRSAGLMRARSTSWQRVGDDYERLYRQALGAGASHGDAGQHPVRSVEVLMVAYGNSHLVDAALCGIPGASVTIVDNSSDPGVREVAERHGTRYVDSGRNGGFAFGVNKGLDILDENAPDADVLLLNPDAVIGPEVIDALAGALAQDPLLASVAPRQIDDDGRPSRVEWPYPTPLGTWIEAVGLGSRRRSNYVIGSVMLLRREALRDVGRFDDERFFLYAEETDWAFRATRRGWRHAVVESVTARHTGGGTSTNESVRQSHFHAGQETYLRKHFGSAGWQFSRVGQIVASTVRGVVLPGERGVAARSRAKRYLRGPRRMEIRPGEHDDRLIDERGDR